MKKIINKSLLMAIGLVAVLLSSCFKDKVNEAIGILNDEISLYTLRDMWKGKELSLNVNNLGGARYTGGVVISNQENGNLPEGYIVIQDAWRGQVRGIVLQVGNPSDFHFGDSVLVRIDHAKLTRKDGPLTLVGLESGDVQVLVSGRNLEHKAISISTLNTTPDQYESTLISVTADVEDLQPDATLEGSHTLTDGADGTLELYTYETANFKDTKLAPNASFMGIALSNGTAPILYMQKGADMDNPSGKIYPGWPETFEDTTVSKGSYNMPDIDNIATFSTGEWYLYYAIVGTTAGRDRIVSGEKAIRVQQNRTEDSYIEMDFDVPDGASKVTFWYGSYYNDRSCTFRLEYSTDQGLTWQQIGEDISDAQTQAENSDAKQAVFLMDIQGPVRFRINKLGLGTSSPTVSNGRLGVDDFAIYKSY